MQSLSPKKRVRSDSDESGSGSDSVDAKKILLDILDDSDICTVSQDLDSFIKSFQDEISPDLTSESADSAESTESSTESRQELGFLLEASDDELGLPPSDANTSSTGEEKSKGLGDSVELSELWGLDEQIENYGPFEYEFGYNDDVNISNYNNNNGEYVALDGLFDHADLGFGSPDLLWQPETLPAQ